MPVSIRTIPAEIHSSTIYHLGPLHLPKYASICRETKNAAEYKASPWILVTWHDQFELAPKDTGKEFESLIDRLRARIKIQHSMLMYTHNRSDLHAAALQCLRDIIVDSWTDDYGKKESRNIIFLENLEQAKYITDVLLEPMIACWKKDHGHQPALAATIQLCLIHLRFNDFRFKRHQHIRDYPTARQAVYVSPYKNTLFIQANRSFINASYLRLLTNFFVYHLSTRSEPENLRGIYHTLGRSQQMQSWTEPLSYGARPIGHKWASIYSHIRKEDRDSIRTSKRNNPRTYTHEFNWIDDAVAIGKARFYYNPHADHYQNVSKRWPWPLDFEERLLAFSHRAQKHAVTSHSESVALHGPENTIPEPAMQQFQMEGFDVSRYVGTGWIAPMPAQEGIEGWCRFTMVKIYLPLPPDGVNTFEADAMNHVHPPLGSGHVNLVGAARRWEHIMDWESEIPVAVDNVLPEQRVSAAGYAAASLPADAATSIPKFQTGSTSNPNHTEFLTTTASSGHPRVVSRSGPLNGVNWSQLPHPDIVNIGAGDVPGLDHETKVMLMEGVVIPGGQVIVGKWWQHDREPETPGLTIGLAKTEAYDEPGAREKAKGVASGAFMMWRCAK